MPTRQLSAIMCWLDYADGSRRVGFIAQLGDRNMSGEQGRSDVWHRLYQTAAGPVLCLKLLVRVVSAVLELEIFIDPGSDDEMDMLRALSSQDGWHVHCFQSLELRESLELAQLADSADWVAMLARASGALASTPIENRNFEAARQIVLGLQPTAHLPHRAATTLTLRLPQLFQPQTRFSYN